MTSSPSIILHHYSSSPYSEKLRAILGFKGVAWQSVKTPAILPKPDLMPLTGGYRRAPVLQVGRDVYCDTRLAVRVLERLAPTPPLMPSALKGSIAAFVEYEQTLFFGAVASNFQPAGLKAMIDRMGAEMMDAFIKDRAAFFVGGSAKRPGPEYSKLHFVPALNALDAQLAASPFLLGDAPTLADFIAYHPIWFVDANAGVRSMLEPFHNLTAWFARIKAIGHGTPTELTGEQALDICRSTTVGQPFDGPNLELHNLALGQRVKVQATDYGVDAVEGVLLHASVFEFAIRREDPRAGEVIVHFPRSGFAISAAG